ncbi:MAG: threonylcarbamoyl-AMP synthase [Eggerthellaceae bacterium]|nr:threonylcarbamoyl-AMP synthase [Eggerthellaceae bacterium]
MDKTVIVNKACEVLKEGGVVLLPTDTVYGLCMAAKKDADFSKIYAIKGRLPEKPLGCFIGGKDDLKRYASNIPDYVYTLVDAFWPGKLSIVLDASDKICPFLVAADGSVMFRQAKSELIDGIISSLDCPLAQTSANLSGKDAVAGAKDLDARIVDAVDYAYRNDSFAAGKDSCPSTVVDCRGKKPIVLREGAVSVIDIMSSLGL